eukprot:TRINITY_DN1588_c0_g2_i2.p1 TRINITY_DN1588_c0_g2~~TRINITY_DN1588_c0_g2_i2.p1  ORF type:complete len:668 (+),score=131.80 TRINITY_DN1588_c0_g2_i2:535-2538(+)
MEPEKRQKILREAELIQSLQHPNIIKCLEHFIEDNVFILIFEWAALGDIKRLVKKAAQTNTHLEERVIWSYAYQIAGALGYMHDQRIMHRDIKPANIFIAADGSLRIGDLGLGREFSSKTMEAFSKVGTPLYMSPEVIHGDGYDFRSDVWSLGCVLYELTTLRSPFRAEGTNIYGIFKKIKNGEFKPIGDGYSQELRSMIHRMLSLEPEKRPSMPDVRSFAKRQCEVYKQIQNQVSPLIVMDNVIEKLKLIDYEEGLLRPYSMLPLSRTEFALPPPATSGEGASSTVFHRFITLVTWLVKLNGVDVAMPSIEDDPAVLTTDILVHLKSLGVSTNFAPAKFQKGYGDIPCVVLNHLLNLVLKRREFTFKQPKFEAHTSNSGEGSGAAIADEAPDDLDTFVQASSRVQRIKQYQDSTAPTSTTAGDSQSTLQQGGSKVRPNDISQDRGVWREELDRVTPMLKVVRAGDQLDSQWMRRLEVLTRAAEQLQADKPEIVSGFQDLAERAGEDAARLRRREEHYNEECQHVIAEYAQVCRKLAQFVDTHSASLDQVNTLSTELANVVDELEGVKEQIDAHGAGVSGDEPLHRIRAAIKRVKRDIAGMDARLAMVQQRVWCLAQNEYDRKKEEMFASSALASALGGDVSLSASMSLSSSQPLRGLKTTGGRKAR